MKRLNLKKSAFTLIELLVVIAIISLLVSILLPSLNTAKKLAQRVACMSGLRNMGIAASLYESENEGFLPPRVYSSNIDLAEISSSGGIPVNTGILYSGGYIDSVELFYCPADKHFDQYPAYQVLKADTSNFGTPVSSAGLYSSYRYLNRFDTPSEDTFRPAGLGGDLAVLHNISKIQKRNYDGGNYASGELIECSPSEYAIVSDSYIRSLGGTWGVEVHGDGYSVLYADGHSNYYSDSDGWIDEMYLSSSYSTGPHDLVWQSFDGDN